MRTVWTAGMCFGLWAVVLGSGCDDDEPARVGGDVDATTGDVVSDPGVGDLASEPEASGDGAVEPTALELCQESCQVGYADCDSAEWLDPCLCACSFLVASWRSEYSVSLFQCLRELPCHGDYDEEGTACDALREELEPSTAFSEFQDECLARHSGCGESFPESMCAEARSFLDPIIVSMRPCLEESCDEIESCLVQYLEPSNCGGGEP
jgi:hypothetical protein